MARTDVLAIAVFKIALDAEKRARAHFIIDTGGALTDTERQIGELLRAVAGMAAGL